MHYNAVPGEIKALIKTNNNIYALSQTLNSDTRLHRENIYTTI